jgi:RNA polymerase sigma-70 factor (ECF subfamily)
VSAVTAHSEFDRAVRAACEAGEVAHAATLILRSLGADVVRVLHARFGREELAAEVFSLFAEDLWVGLPSFAFRCSVRAWVFTLARHAGHRFLDRELRKRRAEVPLTGTSALWAEVARVRTETLASLPSDADARLAALRAELSEDDQLLLTLRVNRELEFVEIACVMLGDPAADPAAVRREAARLRKRFQLLKARLRERWRTLGGS